MTAKKKQSKRQQTRNGN